ncbi:MAG: 50S ribosome-binding GTPase [Planctomycetes bacterium]|nr:50S ribosome-binding GTPase [Planctomycetota bacterium]
MPSHELSRLQLLAEIDALLAQLRAWSDRAPDWPPARAAAALVDRLQARAEQVRLRIEAPLVVATLGGTGTGKSTLVNALVGAEVTTAGRERPTTRQPVLVTRPGFKPEWLGIDPTSVRHVEADSPTLADYVLLDCPDPDTSEDPASASSNLAQLRRLIPQCDVLLVTTTQQKYRSARVADELAEAASGVRLVFVQTHADTDSDIRDDWRRALGDEFAAGEMFLVDGPAALRDQQQGLAPRGEFGRLVQWLARQLAGTARLRIRRANLLDLLDESLAACRARVDAGLPQLEQLESAIVEQRTRVATQLAERSAAGLTRHRRAWENRILAEVTGAWGLSPFSGLLRLYLGLGGLLSSLMLLKMRSTAQVAIWGAMEGARRLRNRWSAGEAELPMGDAALTLVDEETLRTGAVIVDGYAAEAQLPRTGTHGTVISGQTSQMVGRFAARVANDVQELVAGLAQRHTGWFTRLRYELLLLVVLGGLFFRWGRNFFYDSWLAVEFGRSEQAAPLLGTDFYWGTAFALLIWCGLLLWLFTGRLRRGLSAELKQAERRWARPELTAGLFADLEERLRAVRVWREELIDLQTRTSALGNQALSPSESLGQRTARSTATSAS